MNILIPHTGPHIKSNHEFIVRGVLGKSSIAWWCYTCFTLYDHLHNSHGKCLAENPDKNPLDTLELYKLYTDINQF